MLSRSEMCMGALTVNLAGLFYKLLTWCTTLKHLYTQQPNGMGWDA